MPEKDPPEQPGTSTDPDRSDDPVTRRELLQTGAATLATTTVAATAGCFGTMPPLGGRINHGRVDPPTADEPDYRTWVPGSSEFTEPDDGTYYLPQYPQIVQPRAFQSHPHGTYLHQRIGMYHRSSMPYFGLDWNHHHTVIDYFTHVADATYTILTPDTAPAAQTLADSGYERIGTDGEFTLFERRGTDMTDQLTRLWEKF